MKRIEFKDNETVGNAALFSEFQDNIEEAIEGSILWKNDSPNSEMAEDTTISLSSDDYDILEVIWKRTAEANFVYSTKSLKGFSIDLFCIGAMAETTPCVRQRILTRDSDTEFNARSGNYQLCNSNSCTENNSCCIPLYIIGYKTKVFE